jgi:hypothetical protein
MRPAGYKPHDQVLSELSSARSPQEWVLGEIADFLDMKGSEEERRSQSRQLLLRDIANTSVFTDSSSAARTTLAYELRRTRPGEKDEVLVYTTTPSAPALLHQCATMCEIGDRVTLLHLRALGANIRISATWPFSLFDATVMTTPRPEELETEALPVPKPSFLSKAVRTLTHRRD